MPFLKKLFKNSDTPKNIFFAISAVIAIWYILSCFAHYFSLRPLWNDEEAVFKSIVQFSSKEMFTAPLLSYQVFPRVYLFLIQKISQPFEFHLLSLRFLSFIFMIAAFLIWIKVSGYEMKDKKERITFLLSWCASVPLIYYSAELKQYSMDVLSAAIFLLFLINQQKLKENSKKYLICLAFLPVLILFSYPTFFFIPIVFYNLIILAKDKRDSYKPILVFMVSVLIFFILSYFFDMRLRPPTKVFMEGHGQHFILFDSAQMFFTRLGEGINNLFSRWFSDNPKLIRRIARCFTGFGLIYLFYGFFSRFKKEKFYLCSISTIALVLFVEHFILGVLKLYPFVVARTSLFFCPIILFLTIKGISETRRIHIVFYRILHSLYIIFLVFVSFCISRIVFTGPLSFAPSLW